MFLKFNLFRVWYPIFYSKLVDCIFFKIVVQHFYVVKGRGHVVARKKKYMQAFPKYHRISLTSPLYQLREKSCHLIFTKCGEPCIYDNKYFINYVKIDASYWIIIVIKHLMLNKYFTMEWTINIFFQIFSCGNMRDNYVRGCDVSGFGEFF
jgi:hypothetical protein